MVLMNIEVEENATKKSLDGRDIELLLENACNQTGYIVSFPTVIEIEKDKPVFCECCGTAISRILEKLERAKWEAANETSPTLSRTDGLHFQYKKQEGTDEFYSRKSMLVTCKMCGVLLKDEDMHGQWEVMGECHGRPERQYMVTGYACHYCDYKEEY